ncbi:MAG TPA: R3H domain-containing nucleic acid-binding protein [Anaerolineales bacterium]|nr:R3H domain-containing nucleic acid-binding protein [Anaerolineales bacterium]
MTALSTQDELYNLLNLLPERILQAIATQNRQNELLEIVLDLGRVPTARYPDGEVVLSNQGVSASELESVVSQIGEFDSDNRAGMERTLHRISAIRNRRGAVVGLTCRIGRAVFGTIEIIEDLVTSGKSILLLGRPGVGKTTMLREAARVLAETRRVIIVDTSNEIGGDGDIPHPAVGRARRMQVANPSLQHEVMIEAVENHNPEIIVIDEIGRELEAAAARTIAERGVQLIGTAHGNTLDNILLNPTLADLVGGIESVTLSDEEARRRGTQKTVLERRSPPTFDVLIELQERERLVVHPDISLAVDTVLRGRTLTAELRSRNAETGKLENTPYTPPQTANRALSERTQERGKMPNTAGNVMPWAGGNTQWGDNGGRRNGYTGNGYAGNSTSTQPQPPPNPAPAKVLSDATIGKEQPGINLFIYGINRQRLAEAAHNLRIPLTVVEDLQDADGLLTLKSYYRRSQRPISDAEALGLPIYVLRSNTAHQIEAFLLEQAAHYSDDEYQTRLQTALNEAEHAIREVSSSGRSLDLRPQDASIRRRQHQLIRDAQLISQSYGREPNRRVRIFRE